MTICNSRTVTTLFLSAYLTIKVVKAAISVADALTIRATVPAWLAQDKFGWT